MTNGASDDPIRPSGARPASASIDLILPSAADDPFEIYDALRADAPVVWSARLGYWMALSYAAAHTALRDTEHFSSALRGSAEASLYGAATMIFVDAPDHLRLRRAISKGFAACVGSVQNRLRPLAEEIVDGAFARGEFDAVADITGPLPVVVISEMLALPTSDVETLKHASDELVALSIGTKGGTARRKAAAADLRGYFREYVRDLPAEPGNPMIATLRELVDDGADQAELAAACMLLLVAGHETSTRFLSNCLLVLARDSELTSRLRDGAVSIRVIVEELLRVVGPVHVLRRTTTASVELDGVALGPGERVAVFVAAANRDPDVFECPAEIRLDRANPERHLAFGAGPHYCLGAALARLEAEAMLGAIALRLVDGRLELTSDDWTYAPSFFVRGPASLPMRFTSPSV